MREMLKLARKYETAISFAIVLLLLALGSAWSMKATAQEQHAMPEGLVGKNRAMPMICAKDARDMYNALKKTHGEAPVVLGFSNQGPVAVVWFTNEQRTTLSVVVDAPDESCMIFSTRCMPGDCFVSAEENYEREKEKVLPKSDSPKVSL